jgi:hypothetical protein
VSLFGLYNSIHNPDETRWQQKWGVWDISMIMRIHLSTAATGLLTLMAAIGVPLPRLPAPLEEIVSENGL